jgi:hypothetical protein
MKYCFEPEEPRDPERRRNRLKRIAHESQEQDEGQIEHWLELGGKMLDGDDDPGSSVA